MAAVVVPVAAADMATTSQATSVYIVRHGEKADASRDPALSTAGQARARTLAHVLSDAGLDAIFVTDTQRSRQTAAPVAAATGLAPTQYDARDAAALAATIAAEHAGQQVLVVGHSNTLDDIAAAFGIAGLADLEESQFDRLYVVRSSPGIDGELLMLRYGVATP
jgi:broad specificity phosphatase PhoE